mgnify:CR=1 FL=1
MKMILRAARRDLLMAASPDPMGRPTAYSTLRLTPHYRHDAFAAGLERAGFAVSRVRPVAVRTD